MDAYTLTDVKYHHFNVYTEAKDDIILQFASRIADSKVAKVASKGTKRIRSLQKLFIQQMVCRPF